MKFTIKRERFEDIMHELPWLFAQQYGELVLDKDGLRDDPDYARYLGLEKLEVLHCITVRHEEKLVGYFFNMVVFHLHHKGLKTSCSDLLYILPEYRKGTGMGLALLNEGIRQMKKLGVQKMYVGSKKDTRLSKLLNHMGFTTIEENHSLWIGE